MPILRRRKSDGGYIIRTRTYAAGANTTYQVTDEGVSLLGQQYGIRVDDSFDRRLLQLLIDRNLAYTGGGGLSTEEAILHEYGGTIAQWREWLRLRLDKSGTPGGLQLIFPELTTEQLAQVPGGAFVPVLDRCTLNIVGVDRISAAELWPGKGGARKGVRPREVPYTVNIEGDWPDVWPRSYWSGECPGLRPSGTCFNTDGLRVRDGTNLYCGDTYHLLVHRDEISTTLNKTRPYSVSVVQGVRLDKWEIWTITLPANPDEQLRHWISSLGYKLRERPWRLALVSPVPLWQADDGLPAIPLVNEVALEVLLPDCAATPTQLPAMVLQYEETLPGIVPAGHGRITTAMSVGGRRGRRGGDDRRALYLALPLDQPGRYQLWFADPPSPALALAVTSEPTCDPLHLIKGLAVRWTNSSTIIEVDALADGVGPHTIPIAKGDGLPAISIDCPVPLTLRLTPTVGLPLTRECKANEVSTILAAEFPAAKLTGALSVDLDAGAFGRCLFSLAPEATSVPRPDEVRRVVPGALLRRARWLRTVSNALPRREPCPMSALPDYVSDSLGVLDRYPGLASMRRQVVVPSALLSQYVALAAALRPFHDSTTPD